MIQYSIPEHSHFTYHIHDEKAMYPLWELQQGVLYQAESCCKTHEVFQYPFINIEN